MRDSGLNEFLNDGFLLWDDWIILINYVLLKLSWAFFNGTTHELFGASCSKATLKWCLVILQVFLQWHQCDEHLDRLLMPCCCCQLMWKRISVWTGLVMDYHRSDFLWNCWPDLIKSIYTPRALGTLGPLSDSQTDKSWSKKKQKARDGCLSMHAFEAAWINQLNLMGFLCWTCMCIVPAMEKYQRQGTG